MIEQIDFEYYLEKDTIEEVVLELTNCINLVPSESEIVTRKLSHFCKKINLISSFSIKVFKFSKRKK